MFCAGCGTQLSDEQQFCVKCGARSLSAPVMLPSQPAVTRGGTANHVFLGILFVWTAFMFSGALAGMMNVSSRGDLSGAAALGAGIGFGLLAIIWFIPAVVLLLIAIATKPPVSVPWTVTQRAVTWTFAILLSIAPLSSVALRDSRTSSVGGSSTSDSRLALLSSRGYQSVGGNYYIVEGEVRNDSTEGLKSVEVVSTWYASDGTLVTSDSAVIEYNPILPGQTSPFKTMSRMNPAMSKYTVSFKSLFGPEIQTTDLRRSK